MAIEAKGWGTDLVTRLFAGVSVGARSGRLKAALLRCRGEGWSLRCLTVDAITLPPPPPSPIPLAEAISDALVSLSRHCELPLGAIDVVGLARWRADGDNSFVASLVAERTGITVVGDFDLADRAKGGRGGPLSPLPDWFLFRSVRSRRLVLQLGATLRATVLAPGEAPSTLACFDAGPCGEFLDGLCQDLSLGRYPFDPGGRFAVQGRVADALVAQWLSHPFLLRPPPKFLASGDFGPELRQTSLAYARENHLSARDILRSANQFVVAALAEAIRRFIPQTKTPDEIWVSGGGAWNGLLWKLLHEAFDPIPVGRSDEVGIPSEALRSVRAALLAYCAMEYLPANVPAITGARQPTVLGQITPGSLENWDRWIINLAERFDLRENQAA